MYNKKIIINYNIYIYICNAYRPNKKKFHLFLKKNL